MTGHYRLIEAIVKKLESFNRLILLTGHKITDGDGQEFHIAEDVFDSTSRTPFIGVGIDRDLPLNSVAPHAGWLRSRVRICAYDKSDAGVKATLILDYISYLLRLADHDMDRNRRFLDFTNESIQNRETRFISRTGVTHDDGRDVWEGKIVLEVIWLDRSCDGECKPVDLDECDTIVDCGNNCP